MAKLSWNEFRAAHKGTALSEIKDLWADYKEGKYTMEETVEEVVEEVTAEPTKEDLLKEYNELYNLIYISHNEHSGTDVARLRELAKLTGKAGYTCEPTDGWTLWLGPSQSAMLQNISKGATFLITRQWFKKFYGGSAMVDQQVFDGQEQYENLRNRTQKMGDLIRRYPIPGEEIKLPQSKLGIQLPR